MNTDAIFEVTVTGTYQALREGSKGRDTLHFPEQKIKVPAESLEKVISILKFSILPMVLRKLNPRFSRVREVIIEETKAVTVGASFAHLSDTKKVRLMSRSQLEKFCVIHQLPVITDIFPTTQALRDAILMAMESPEAFLKRQARAQNKQGSLKSIMDLNPSLGAPAQKTEDIAAFAKSLGTKVGTAFLKQNRTIAAALDPTAIDMDTKTKAELISLAVSLGLKVDPKLNKTLYIAEIVKGLKPVSGAGNNLDIDEVDEAGITVTRGDYAKSVALNDALDSL